jgi:hypothetical protein
LGAWLETWFGSKQAAAGATKLCGCLKRSAFLAYDLCGSLLWSGFYTGLGYLFANRIAAIAVSLARFGDISAALIDIPLACYVGWRIWIIAHMLGHLHLRRITPALLHEKIMSGKQIAIIDLLSFEEEPANSVAFLELFAWTPLDSEVERRW